MLDYDLIFSLINKRSVKVNAIAKFSGMTPDGFTRSLKNKKLTVATLEKIAEFLEVHPSIFFLESGPAVNQEIEILRLKLEAKNRELKDKEEIIQLLKRQIK